MGVVEGVTSGSTTLDQYTEEGRQQFVLWRFWDRVTKLSYEGLWDVRNIPGGIDFIDHSMIEKRS